MVTVRPAVPDDADAIARIHVETWRAAYAGLLPDDVLASLDVEARRRTWRGWLARDARPGAATFVAEGDATIVGFASTGPARDEEATGELYAIYVEPDHWGTGAGRLLLEHAEAALREDGYGAALLWVLEGNERAERFYRAAGWGQDGLKLDLLMGAEVTERRYRKAL